MSWPSKVVYESTTDARGRREHPRQRHGLGMTETYGDAGYGGGNVVKSITNGGVGGQDCKKTQNS